MHHPIFSIVTSLALIVITAAQSDTTACNSNCINYLSELETAYQLNINVRDHSGPVDAPIVKDVCDIGHPVACCECGGTGISNDVQMQVLTLWSLVCSTYYYVGVDDAVGCWNLEPTCYLDGTLGLAGGQNSCLVDYQTGDFSFAPPEKKRSVTDVASSVSSSVFATQTNANPTAAIAKSEGPAISGLIHWARVAVAIAVVTWEMV
jgi:hypothetical protein